MNQGQTERRFVRGDMGGVQGVHRFSRDAMATVFEVIIGHEDFDYARQASLAAFERLEGLEGELSRFIENSDISRINNLQPKKRVVVGEATFECLQLCMELYSETNGAFDVTVGSLMECRGGKDETKRAPSEEELNHALERTGAELIKLNEEEHTVEVRSEGVRIDLGGIGKGYAVDKMAEVLCEWGIEEALIHGGHSTVLALGGPEGTKGWAVALSNPSNRKEVLAHLCLCGEAVSGSGLEKGEHIIDPRSGGAVCGRSGAWAIVSGAARADALSTAFMVMTAEEIEEYCQRNPQTLAMVMGEEAQGGILRFGPWKDDELIKK